tara:strand:- start:129 stop:443 length:315 start_codon:yes stop_codon:yes gene_type:complete
LKVYISGPITNEEQSESRFTYAVDYLLDKGLEPINPYDIATPEKSNGRDTWSYYMRESVKLLAEAEKVYMLEGWTDSRGATIEHHLARDLNIPIMYETEDIKYV